MDPKLRQLQAFVHAYHLGSVTKAAERMHVTQAAASILVRQLEDVLGVRLFDRTSRSLKPTSAARDLLASAERTLRDMEELRARAKGVAQRTEGHVRVGVTSAVACTFLPMVVKSFRARYPGVRLVIQDMSPDQLLAPVLREEVEFSIGTPEEKDDGVVLTTLLQDYLSVIFCEDSPLASRDVVTWSEISNYETITVRHGNHIRALVESAMAQIGGAYEPAYEVSFLTTALAMTAEGIAVSVLPSYLVESFQHHNLMAKRLTAPVVARNLFLITKRGSSLSPAAESFVALLEEFIANKDSGGKAGEESFR